ncbi:MAG: ornithine cyclodeaminase family protein [Armatimonadetes bacterium]|nr:ornithine cyclodeaminase family protein [Armatimonadota bacterium]
MLLLTQSEIRSLLNLDDLLDAVSGAMADISAGRASQPPRIGASVEGVGFLGAMAAYCPSANALASKLVSVFPGNHEKGLPSHQAVIVVFDPATGQAIAMLDGTEITATRTAAASALSVKLLSRPESSVLAILGTGVQAESHAKAVTRVRDFKEIRIASRSLQAAEKLANRMKAELDLPFRAVSSWAEATQGADVVCATTHPHDPVVRREWLSPGAHVTSVGLSAEGREVDAETVRQARIFVEQRSTATLPFSAGSNDLRLPFEEGAFTLNSLTEIGEVVLGVKPGRQSAEEITLYKSVGVGVQDAAAASLVLRRARELGVGKSAEL